MCPDISCSFRCSIKPHHTEIFTLSSMHITWLLSETLSEMLLNSLDWKMRWRWSQNVLSWSSLPSIYSFYSVHTLTNDCPFLCTGSGHSIASNAKMRPQRANKSIRKVLVNKPRGMLSAIMTNAKMIFYPGFFLSMHLFNKLHSLD